MLTPAPGTLTVGPLGNVRANVAGRPNSLTVGPALAPATGTASPSPASPTSSAYVKAYNTCCATTSLGCISQTGVGFCRARAQQAQITRVLSTPTTVPPLGPPAPASSAAPAGPVNPTNPAIPKSPASPSSAAGTGASTATTLPQTYVFGPSLLLPCTTPPQPQNTAGYASYLANCKKPRP